MRSSNLRAGDATAHASIASLTVKGLQGAASFINSNVSAWTLGTISIRAVQADNSDQPFGITGHSVGSYTRDGTRLPKPAGTLPFDSADDYVAQLSWV
ncbi:MAG: hypothetical protein NTU94_17620 [Planctomycetota bacterium]|nr:hypothetical protein [Planctomycetota bacterium]